MSRTPWFNRRREATANPDLVVLSHLRWDFVYQRPQHLLSRCARERRVFFFEEPVFGDHPVRLEVSPRDNNLYLAVPRLPAGLAEAEVEAALRQLIDELLVSHDIKHYGLWYYTPMALGFAGHLEPLVTVFDCMDELSAFRFAPPKLRERDAELMRRADVVFTGGQSLYESRRDRHDNIHPFPSSVDVAHFKTAREIDRDPADQAGIPHPRLGFFGVIDERMDLELLHRVAGLRPDWQLVMVGPVVKIDPRSLPSRRNIHYLGGKSYQELPHYLAGWDVALLPFARNESTRFISPTKTPEYLAAGCPVVSTSIRDVVRPYGELGLVRIADRPEAFVEAIEAALAEDTARRLEAVDAFLATTSWDHTWQRMPEHIEAAADARHDRLTGAMTARAGVAAVKERTLDGKRATGQATGRGARAAGAAGG